MMSRYARPATDNIPRFQRFLLIALGSVLLALLATTASLRPATSGHGTHQQLGLPPCAVQMMWKIRCPSCGMTTSWAHFVRGQWIRSLQANSGGALLAVIASLVGLWALITGCWGRWWWQPFRQLGAVVMAIVVTLVTLIDWALRLVMS